MKRQASEQAGEPGETAALELARGKEAAEEGSPEGLEV